MRYGVLGTGMVGQTLATRLAELGHDVMMGSRSADNKESAAWRQRRRRQGDGQGPAARDIGWTTIIDLGDITAARATEQLMPIWLRLYGLFGSADFNFKLVRPGGRQP